MLGEMDPEPRVCLKRTMIGLWLLALLHTIETSKQNKPLNLKRENPQGKAETTPINNLCTRCNIIPTSKTLKYYCRPNFSHIVMSSLDFCILSLVDFLIDPNAEKPCQRMNLYIIRLSKLV